MTFPTIPSSHSWTHQFTIGRSTPKRPGWIECLTVGDFSVHLYPEAEIVPVHDSANDRVGLFVGHVIDTDARQVVSGQLTFDPPSSSAAGVADDGALDRAVEDFAYRYGGSWLFLLGAGVNRLYVDCTGSRSVVFSPEQQTAAATTGLLLNDDEYQHAFRSDLYADLGVEDAGWFPGGYTAHRGVHRLLPNHYLSLDTWTTHRHWPVDSIPNLSVEAASQIVSDITLRGSQAIVESGLTLQGLTGGTETRFMLAANRALTDNLSFVTLAGPTAKRDMTLASRVVELTGINHRFLELRQADSQEQTDWLFKAGHCITGNNMVNHPSLAPLSNYDALLGGLGGEVGRAFFWRPTDSTSTKLSAATIAARFGMPQHHDVVDATERWFEPMAAMDPLLVLDLAYLELRLGPWAFAQKYTTSYVNHVYPMVHRQAYEALLGLSAEHKRSSAFITEGIRQSWPELLSVPINEYGDYRDHLEVLAKVTNPRLVATKLRKRLG